MLGAVVGTSDAVGARELVASAAWSNERWPYFGVEEHPDLEAVRRHDQMLTDLNWLRYMEGRSTLGTEMTLPGT